ncbi:MAG: ABC transporter permease [Chloroflexota bacterium]
MIGFIIRRLITLIPILFLISVVSFAIIELPPGDFATYYIENLRTTGVELSADEEERIKHQFGLGGTAISRYFRWMENIITEGNFGWSFAWQRPVNEILQERLPLTVLFSLLSLIVSWAIAIPIGIYSATHQYSFLDYIFTFIGFIGLATPAFLLALVMAWAFFRFFNFSALGLYSAEYIDEPMSIEKFIDLLKHMVLPIVLIGLAGTGGTIRVMRGNLLDELKKPYVVTARAKGVTEMRLLFKYPVRLAFNPIISTIGWLLPAIVAGEVLVSIVLSIQTIGPTLLRAVLSQDMFLAGSIVMVLSTLTVIGSLLSDIALVLLDPRIRYEENSA